MAESKLNMIIQCFTEDCLKGVESQCYHKHKKMWNLIGYVAKQYLTSKIRNLSINGVKVVMLVLVVRFMKKKPKLCKLHIVYIKLGYTDLKPNEKGDFMYL